MHRLSVAILLLACPVRPLTTGVSPEHSHLLNSKRQALRIPILAAAALVAALAFAFAFATIAHAAPALQITDGPEGPTSNDTPTFGFIYDAGATVECSVDQGTPSYAPCTGANQHTSVPLDDGDWTFRVSASDGSPDSPSIAERSFTVDTAAPVVSIAFGPSGLTTDDSPLFEFSVTGASATECSIDQGVPAFGPCSSPTSHAVTQRLAQGGYVFRVRGSDPAGNATTATRSFGVVGPGEPGPPVTAATPPRLMSPFPLVRLTGRLTPNGAEVQVLSVRAPRGALARVNVKPKCAKKKPCPAKSGRATIGAKGAVRFRKLELGYRAGTVIEVRVSRPGAFIGKYTRFLVRRGKTPQRVDRCLMPDAKRGSACPAG
jgi:hypothetical protein